METALLETKRNRKRKATNNNDDGGERTGKKHKKARLSTREMDAICAGLDAPHENDTKSLVEIVRAAFGRNPRGRW
jgi:hypothetical protein